MMDARNVGITQSYAKDLVVATMPEGTTLKDACEQVNAATLQLLKGQAQIMFDAKQRQEARSAK